MKRQVVHHGNRVPELEPEAPVKAADRDQVTTRYTMTVVRFGVRVEGDDILIGDEVVVPDARGAAARVAVPEEAR